MIGINHTGDSPQPPRAAHQPPHHQPPLTVPSSQALGCSRWPARARGSCGWWRPSCQRATTVSTKCTRGAADAPALRIAQRGVAPAPHPARLPRAAHSLSAAPPLLPLGSSRGASSKACAFDSRVPSRENSARRGHCGFVSCFSALRPPRASGWGGGRQLHRRARFSPR